MQDSDLINIVDNNAKRSVHLSRMRDHQPYSNEEMMRMFGPYLRDFSHEGDLGPREARLLETWFRDFRSLFSCSRANTEYDAELSRERNKGFELQKTIDELEAQIRQMSEKQRQHKDELAQMHEQRRNLEAQIGTLNHLVEQLREQVRIARAQYGTLGVFTDHYRQLSSSFDNSKNVALVKDARLSNIVIQP